MKYKVCDAILGSALPLPELAIAVNELPDSLFELLSSRPQVSNSCEWFHSWCLSGGEPSALFGKCETGYLVRFPEMADFLISRNLQQISCWPCPEVPLETIRHLLLDQIIPVVVSGRGTLVLHASAVLTPHGAIAFIGETGWGKSTLASSFCEKRFAILTDDCLLIKEENGQLVAMPSYPGLLLWPETVDELFGPVASLSAVAHYSKKKRLVHVGLRFCTEPAPLRRIYFLAPPEHSSATRIHSIWRSEVFMELVKYTYLLDITDRLQLQAAFERIAQLAALPVFWRLTFSRDFALLSEVREAILENLRQDISTAELRSSQRTYS